MGVKPELADVQFDARRIAANAGFLVLVRGRGHEDSRARRAVTGGILRPRALVACRRIQSLFDPGKLAMAGGDAGIDESNPGARAAIVGRHLIEPHELPAPWQFPGRGQRAQHDHIAVSLRVPVLATEPPIACARLDQQRDRMSRQLAEQSEIHLAVATGDAFCGPLPADKLHDRPFHGLLIFALHLDGRGEPGSERDSGCERTAPAQASEHCRRLQGVVALDQERAKIRQPRPAQRGGGLSGGADDGHKGRARAAWFDRPHDLGDAKIA